MKISLSRLGSYGRLGNQLFQVAGLLGQAEKYNADPSFPMWKYEQYFERELPHGVMQTNQIKERFFHYHDWELSFDCDLLGYFQSEKYFPSNVKELFKFKQDFIDSVRKKVNCWGKRNIVIQIRRGDYVNNPNYYSIPVIFYIDALYTHFPDWRKCNLIFLSDDLDYCKVHFECLPNAIFPLLSDIESLCLATQCDDFIISNSTFGWWSAWLGEKEGTKIIHCGQLLTGKLAEQNDSKDYYPQRWIRHEHKKINLKDVTFTIPVFYDHQDRKKNLDLSLCMIQTAFESNYIVQENGGNKFEYVQEWVKYSRVDHKYFHRTKMLNDMANESTTPIIVNWDCDVIIPPMQIIQAAEKLRNGADMVFPYDGRFARMPRLYNFEKIEKSLDIGVVGNTQFRGREATMNSVGGAVMFRKDSFIDGGMENENMVSFGPEDCERNDRFKALGYKVERVKGCLFHMDHFVGTNSSPANGHFRSNHIELEKIRKMSPTELREYVNTWEWRPLYTDKYYEKISEGAIRSAKHVYAALEKLFKFETIIDIGCGIGEWFYKDYIGIDHNVSSERIVKGIGSSRYADIDLNKEQVNGQLVRQKFDLAICLEVAEHLFEERARPLVESLCNLSDKVLFSAGIPGQGGTGHINCKWQTWWAALFSEHGFYPAKKQPDIRKNAEIELWYRQNIVLYEKGGKGTCEDFVLPEYYEEMIKSYV